MASTPPPTCPWRSFTHKNDRDLATVSIWDEWDGVTKCTQPGDVVKFKRFTGLQMYQGDCFYFSSRTEDMEF
ncbi:hypothetical protein PHMEG_00014782 [Phytophthora megakarya]|uniref:Uncharacterized protein n=1 Tax=Phytophthora megakarya TaxID=4795 RepID=A0A225W331_9STRA|nr:hypothetical protein PHMEG_00014782 [Phytophthora megakarya]